MSTWFYGVLHRSEDTVIVMYVGKGFGDPDEVLRRHIEYAKSVLRAMGVVGAVAVGATNRRVLGVLNKAVSQVRSAYGAPMLFYALLTVYSNIEPEIIDEYELDELERRGVKVIVLGEEW